MFRRIDHIAFNVRDKEKSIYFHAFKAAERTGRIGKK